MKRPNFIGPGLDALTSYLFINHRKELLEPWLVRVGAEAHGELGLRLNPDSAGEGFDARTLQNWSPDGTRVLFWEARGDPNFPPDSDTRIVFAHLVDRRPIAPAAPPHAPQPRWAPVLDGFVPAPDVVPESRPGKSSGSVHIETQSAANGRTVREGRYAHFSDDGEWIYDGFERAEYAGGLLGGTTYTADLQLEGHHRGFLRAAATLSAGGMTGTIDSEVDGRALHLPHDDASSALGTETRVP